MEHPPPPLSSPLIGQSIAGRIFVVTGGTQGLGLEIARNLKKLGARGLILVSRNRQRGAELEAELSTSLSSEDDGDEEGSCCCTCRFVYADLGNANDALQVIPQAIQVMKDATVDIVPIITGLVNAAATTARGNLLTTSAQEFDDQMSINVRAPMLLTQGLAKHLTEMKAAGSVVNITSCAAHGGAPFIMAYSVSKAALVTLTKNNAAELAPHRIRVNAVNMGWCLTDNEDKIQRAQNKNGADNDNSWIQKADAGCPLGRILRPADVAATVCFLLSDCSLMMTGSILDLHPEYPHGLLSLQATEGGRM
jgi:NAD(P)-dependent dehydrogenase (short-subunit alcohol dehydrogenase family)